ncbi:hypothetical protein WJX77_007687 [Trebouxia sp. C0004]
MTRVCYTTLPTGRPYNNLFPCASFKQTDNFYGKASQRLAEQQQHCTLQIPSMPQLDDAADGTASSTLQTLCKALADLNLDIQRTISDPAAIVNSLATTRFCSKQALKRLASQFKPAANKNAFLCQPLEVNKVDKLSVQDLLDSMPSHSYFDSYSAIELETPSMPPTALQGLLTQQLLDTSDLQAIPGSFATDITKELQQAGIQPMAQSGRQSGLSTTAAQPASSPSVLTELIGGDSSTTHMWDAAQLPQPIMLDTVVRQVDLLGTLVPWETLTADFNAALDTNQKHAAAASVPALTDDSQGELWLSVMACHTLSASCTATDESQNAADDGYINSRSKSCQEIKAKILSSVACSMEECRAQVETAAPELEVPMLCFKPSEQGLMTQLFQAEQCPKAPEFVPASVTDSSVKGSSKLTYHNLVAREVTLQESFYTLPVVLFDDCIDYGLDEAQSKEDMWQQCMAACRFRHLRTGHLDLYMDWSLVDRACPCSASLQTFKRQLKLHSQPDTLPSAAAYSALSDSAIAASVISSIPEGACVVPEILYHAVQQPEQLPRAIKQRLRKQPAYQHAASTPTPAATAVSSQSAANTIEYAPSNHISLHAATRAATDDMPLPQQPTQAKPALQAALSGSKARASGGIQATGVFQQGTKSVRTTAAATAPQAASAGNDMAFFLGLQHRATAPASGAAVPLSNQALPIDLCSDGAEEADEEMAMQLPDVQYVCLQLPEQHARLLKVMQEDQRALLREADGIDAEVAKSSILSIQPVEKALNAAAATERQNPGSRKEALKAYAALAVLRQAAQALTQYGIRYAHLYLRHNLEALPMLRRWCVKMAAALEAAYKQVEAGKLEDHPKQAALHKALTGIQTVRPGAKVLLLGDARAFFTMYKAIVDVGLKPFQLDRDERLLKAGLPAGELTKAAGEAATAADCILVTHQQLVSPGFPFERFGCLLEYVQQPLAKAPANVAEVLSRVPCPRQIFHMDLTTAEPQLPALTRTHDSGGRSKAPRLQPQAGTQHASLLPGALSSTMLMGQGQLHPVSEHEQPNRPDIMAAEEGVARPTAAEECHAEGQGAVAPRQGAMGGSVSQGITPIGKADACHPERPLVVTTNADCLLRRRRSLYEAVLQLEQQNAVVIERDLPYVDLKLAEHLSKLYAMARHSGLSLQYFFTSSQAMTQEVISCVASTFLTELQAPSSNVSAPLALEDNPSASEVMLTSFPSLNPMSAARIISLGCSLSELFSLSTEEQKQLADKLPDIPSIGLDLFFQQATWGQAIVGLLPAAPGPEQHQATLHAGQQPTVLPFDQNVSIGHLPRTYSPGHTHSGQMPTALNSNVPAGLAHPEAALATADVPAAAAPVVTAPSSHASWVFMAETYPLQAASEAAMHARSSNQYQHMGQVPDQRSIQGTGRAVRPMTTGHVNSGRSQQTGNPFSAFQYQPHQQAHSSSHDDAQLNHQHHHQQHSHHFVQDHRQPGHLSDTPFEIQDVSNSDGMHLFEGQTLDGNSGASQANFGRPYLVHHQQQQQQQEPVDWHSYLPEEELEADANAPIFWSDGRDGHKLQQPVCTNGDAVMGYTDTADDGVHAMADVGDDLDGHMAVGDQLPPRHGQQQAGMLDHLSGIDLNEALKYFSYPKAQNPVAHGVKPMLKGKLALGLNLASDVQNTFMAKRQGSEAGRCTFARQPNIGTCLTPSKQQSGAGVPRADWSAPSHGKQQVHPTSSRTPARAPKKPHPMALNAARRAQMTPAKASLPATAERTVNTPAKLILPSSAVGSDSTPAKRMQSRGGHTPDSGAGLTGRSALDGLYQRQWHQQLDVRAGDDGLGLDVSVGYTGRRLPLRPHPLGSSLPSASAFQHARQVPFRAEAMGSPAPFSNRGRAHDEGHMFDRVGTQAMTTAGRRAQQGLDGGPPCMRPQLRTPSRPNSAGSALRGYVPPDHRSKKILGFQRKVGSKQARLHWQGTAQTYDDADPVTDEAVPSDDDAAMAAADNMSWDLL